MRVRITKGIYTAEYPSGRSDKMKKIGSLLLLILVIYLVSLGINYVWEMAQMPFYVNMRFEDPQALVSCFFASTVDALIVAGIFIGGGILFGSRYWFRHMTIRRISFTVVIGGIIAVIGEVTALRYERWAYSQLMPLIPATGVGIVPVIQMMLLPFVSLKIVSGMRFLRR
jgi:hypothetical protein